MTYTLQSIKVAPDDPHEYIATVVETPSWLGWLFGAKELVKEYEGSGTIWRDVQTGEVKWDLCSWLDDIAWKFARDRRGK